jgi:hypothetical protein
MAKQLGYCGNGCDECPAYKFQQKDDPEARRKAAADWSKAFNADIKPEMMFCVGCTVTGEPHVGYCWMCNIRICATKKNVATCAECADYPCKDLSAFHANAKGARENLEARRAQRK